MSLENKISLTMSDESAKKVSDAIAVITGEFGFLQNLSADDRKMLPKMGDKTIAFVQKALEYAKLNSGTVPSFLDVTEFEKDVNLVSALTSLLRPLEQLTEELDDTTMLAGSEAYSAALVFYNAAKSAMKAGVPGMKTVVDDLSARFPGRGTATTATAAK